MTESETNKLLILHFDINETILIGDDAGGDTREECYNKILAKNAFVQIPTSSDDRSNNIININGHKNENGATNITHIKFSTIKPTHWWNGTPIKEANDNTATDDTIELHTKWEWIPNCCPYYRTSYKSKAKDFINNDGHCYRSQYNKMKQMTELATTNASDIIVDKRISHDGGKTHFLLPAFFHTLYNLVTKTNMKADIRIVLRSFGSDLIPVLNAISAFAEGKHPFFPNFHYPDWIVTDDKKLKQLLFRGRWKVNENSEIYQLHDWNDQNKIIASDELVILSLFKSNSLIAIQDDYIHWSRNKYSPSCGKPIWIDTQDQYHIIMDDNIKNDANDSIVSIRKYCKDKYGFSTLSGEQIRKMHGRHLIRVPTIEPILNVNWFLEEIEKCYQPLLESEN